METTTLSLLADLPPAKEIRKELAQKQREVRILRNLLKATEQARAEQEREALADG